MPDPSPADSAAVREAARRHFNGDSASAADAEVRFKGDTAWVIPRWAPGAVSRSAVQLVRRGREWEPYADIVWIR